MDSKKIVIVGVSASGKSAFGRVLAQKLDLSLTCMDRVMWRPGWQYVGDEETVARLNEISQRDEWIIEGYVSKLARSMVFKRADSIIYLNYSRYICLWRYLKRVWKHRKNPRPELPGSPEKLSFKFLWLVWTKGEAITLEKFLGEVENKDKIIALHNPKETEEFLNKL